MKDQRKGSKTMMSQMRADMNPVLKQRKEVENSIVVPAISQEEIDKIKSYNTNLTNLNPDYTSLTMVGSILVRCFLYEPKVSEAGLYEPFKTQVSVKTPSGMESLRDVENDYPYSLKAIIVSCPSNYTAIKSGDLIQMKAGAIKDSAVGDLKHGFFLRIHNAFTKINNNPPTTPTDSNDTDYGYITIDYSDIQCLLPH